MSKRRIKIEYNAAKISLPDAHAMLVFDHGMTFGEAYSYLGL
jgi:hypothetical protein